MPLSCLQPIGWRVRANKSTSAIPSALQTVFDKLVEYPGRQPGISGAQRRWRQARRAIGPNLSFNSAAGRLAHVLFGDPVLAEFGPERRLAGRVAGEGGTPAQLFLAITPAFQPRPLCTKSRLAA